MSRWKRLLKEVRKEALEHHDVLAEAGIVQEEISEGLIEGTTYCPNKKYHNTGILLVHGLSHSRKAMGLLAQRIALAGYDCLSLDLPAHGNFKKFTLGACSETVNAGILYLTQVVGVKNVVIVGHSIGATSAIYAHAGYTRKVETQLYSLWHEFQTTLEHIRKENAAHKIISYSKRLEALHTDIKRLVVEGLKTYVREFSAVSGIIGISPPMSAKSAIPASFILKKLGHKKLKIVIEKLLHEPSVKKIQKEGNVIGFDLDAKNKENEIYFRSIKSKDSTRFIKYFFEMKEPEEYLGLMDVLATGRLEDNKIGFIEYHLKRMRRCPKLIIYPYFDLYLKPFLPGNTKKLKKYYSSWGNAEIKHNYSGHIMRESALQLNSSLLVTNKGLTNDIIKFLDTVG